MMNEFMNTINLKTFAFSWDYMVMLSDQATFFNIDYNVFIFCRIFKKMRKYIFN